MRTVFLLYGLEKTIAFQGPVSVQEQILRVSYCTNTYLSGEINSSKEKIVAYVALYSPL